MLLRKINQHCQRHDRSFSFNQTQDTKAARTLKMVANPLWILGVTLGLTLSIASSDPSNTRLHAQAEQIENFGFTWHSR